MPADASTPPEQQALQTVAELMCLAARTAPKARGVDNLYIALVRGDEKSRVTARMRQVAAEHNVPFFGRDADCCDAAPVVVLVGTRVVSVGVPHCGYCGLVDCDARAKQGGLCAYNAIDLGVALGSAAAVAAAHHADNRMMFSFGKSAIEVGLLPPDIQVAIALPLAATGKSPFFDRR